MPVEAKGTRSERHDAGSQSNRGTSSRGSQSGSKTRQATIQRTKSTNSRATLGPGRAPTQDEGRAIDRGIRNDPQGSQSRGSGLPSRPLRSSTVGTVTPNYNRPPGIDDLGWSGALKGAYDSIVGGNSYPETPDSFSGSSQRESGAFGDATGNTGGKDSGREWFRQASDPTGQIGTRPPDAPAMTADQYLEAIMSNFVNPNTRYYLEQRGLVDPTAPAGIPEEWQPVVQREFDFTKSTLPQDWYDPAAKEADTFNKLRTYFSDQFGDTALTNEQNRRRNTYQTQLKGKGFESQLDSAFGDTADDDLINQIIQPQYQSAQDIITNQQKRGTLTPHGYQYALNRLNDQRTAGVNTLQGIGASEREKAGGGVRDYLSSIYSKAGEYQLGQTFDPDAFDAEFGNRLSSASGSLEGNIRGAAPTNLFDTATVQQDAGNVQGQTSRGGLLDTLASRRRGNSRDRGLGTTGAF